MPQRIGKTTTTKKYKKGQKERNNKDLSRNK